MIVIVGAGVAGLTSARKLREAGFEDFLFVERGNDIGGRVATETDGEFLYDVGFAVLNPAYPMVRKYLPLSEMRLGYFDAGALLLLGDGKQRRLRDPFTHPSEIAALLFSSFPSWPDRLRTARLRFGVSRPETPTDQGPSTLEKLQQLGFSEEFIETFFRPFFGGVFLDNTLSVSGELFLYLFDFFRRSKVALPAGGMKAVAAALAAPLPPERFRFGTSASSVVPGVVTLADGSRLDAKAIIVATDEPAAASLRGEKTAPPCRAVSTGYFAVEKLPWDDKLLVLNSSRSGRVNQVAFLSAVQPTYATRGRHLASVTVLGTDGTGERFWEETIRRELRELIGPSANDWFFLREYLVRQALPCHFGRSVKAAPGIFFAGDYVENPSLQGAMLSGERAAQRALSYLKIGADSV